MTYKSPSVCATQHNQHLIIPLGSLAASLIWSVAVHTYHNCRQLGHSLTNIGLIRFVPNLLHTKLEVGLVGSPDMSLKSGLASKDDSNSRFVPIPPVIVAVHGFNQRQLQDLGLRTDSIPSLRFAPNPPITGTFLPHVFHVSHAQALTAGPGHLAHPQNSGPTPRLFPPLAPGRSPAIGRKNRPPVGCSIEYILPEIREYSTEEAGVGLKSLGPSQLAESSEKTATLNKCSKMIGSSEIKV